MWLGFEPQTTAAKGQHLNHYHYEAWMPSVQMHGTDTPNLFIMCILFIMIKTFVVFIMFILFIMFMIFIMFILFILFILVHPLASSFYPSSSSFILFHPFSSSFIFFHLLSSVSLLIYFSCTHVRYWVSDVLTEWHPDPGFALQAKAMVKTLNARGATFLWRSERIRFSIPNCPTKSLIE